MPGSKLQLSWPGIMRLHFTSSVKRSSMHVCMQYANMTDVWRLPSLSEVSTDAEETGFDFVKLVLLTQLVYWSIEFLLK